MSLDEKISVTHNHPEPSIIFFTIDALKITASFTSNEKPGAMKLRTRGHDFMLPFVEYNFNKKNFIARALYYYI